MVKMIRYVVSVRERMNYQVDPTLYIDERPFETCSNSAHIRALVLLTA